MTLTTNSHHSPSLTVLFVELETPYETYWILCLNKTAILAILPFPSNALLLYQMVSRWVVYMIQYSTEKNLLLQ